MRMTEKPIKADSWFKATFLPQHINANVRNGFVWAVGSWLQYWFLGTPLNCDVTCAMGWCDWIPPRGATGNSTGGYLGCWGVPWGQASKARLTCAAAGDSNPRWQAPHPGEQTQPSCRDWLAKILPSSTSCKAWKAAWPTHSRNNEVSDSAGSWHSYRFSICCCIWNKSSADTPAEHREHTGSALPPTIPKSDFVRAYNRWELSWTTASFLSKIDK